MNEGKTTSRAILFAAIAMAAYLTALIVSKALRPVSIGDGSEYLAQALSIANRDGFYLREGSQSWREYDLLHHQGIAAFAPETLSRLWPRLCLANSSSCDYLHFWFYSLVASALGGSLFAHIPDMALYWFSITNAILLVSSCVYVVRLNMSSRQLREVRSQARVSEWIVLLSFVAFSGIAFWVSLVHTEVFTFSCILPAGVLISQARLNPASLLLAIASTQNPFWAPLALLLQGIQALRSRLKNIQSSGAAGPECKYRLSVFAATCLLISIHPFYYYVNYRLLTPTQAAGLEKGLKSLVASSSFALDPSNGFLWYTLAVFLPIAFASAKAIRRTASSSPHPRLQLAGTWPFLLLGGMSLFALYASSQTFNFNHGATFGPSRYGLFILALIYPFYRRSLLYLKPSTATGAAVIGVALTALATGHNPISQFKRSEDDYQRRTNLDQLLPLEFQFVTREPETFLERSLGREVDLTKLGKFIVSDRRSRNSIYFPGALSPQTTATQALVTDLNNSPARIKTVGTLECNTFSKALSMGIGGEPIAKFWSRSSPFFRQKPGPGLWAVLVDNRLLCSAIRKPADNLSP